MKEGEGEGEGEVQTRGGKERRSAAGTSVSCGVRLNWIEWMQVDSCCE